MEENYLEINLEFYNKLSPELRKYLQDNLLPLFKNWGDEEIKKIDNLEDFFKKEVDAHYFLIICPYCNTVGLSISHEMQPIFPPCSNCGESTPYNKLKKGFEKTRNILELAKIYLKNENKEEQKIGKILLEQSVTSMVTNFEVYFKDYYCILQNLRYVKPNKNLIRYFYRQTRNEFGNFVKANDKLSKDLSIDLRNFIDPEEIKKITLLMLKRNAIVHNLGFADESFIKEFSKLTHLEIRINEPVPISIDEIEDCLVILEKLGNSFNEIIKKEIEDVIEEKIKRIIPILLSTYQQSPQ